MKRTNGLRVCSVLAGLTLGIFPALGWAGEAAAAPEVTMQGRSSVYMADVPGGDDQRFQEDRQMLEGWSGGIDELTTRVMGNEWSFVSDVRARHENDYRIDTRWQREDGLYLTQEGNIYPKYYDSSNRFYDYPPFVYELDTDLRALRGNFSVEAGQRSTEGLSAYAGYRHRSRSGETNSYWGGWLRLANPNDWILFVTPIQRERDEKADTFYVGASRKLGGWDWQARQEFERFDGVDTYDEPGYYTNGTQVFTRYYRNQPKHSTWTTLLSGTRDALEGRLRLSLDFQNVAVGTSSNTDVDSLTPALARHYGEHSLNYLGAEHAGRSQTQTLGGRADYAPLDWLRMWLDVRALMGRNTNLSQRAEEGAEAAAVDNNTATVNEFWNAHTLNRELGFSEEVGVEVNALPKTRIALDANLNQNRVKHNWNADVIGASNTGNEGDWSWLSRRLEQRDMYTLSVRNWALPWLTPWARYRYRVDDVDVADRVDAANTKPGDPEYTENSITFYYPGRIEDTVRTTHEALIATSVRLSPRWSFRPQFEHRTSYYEVSAETEPEISSYRSNTVSAGLIGQPLDDLTCSFNFSKQFAKTWTRAASFSNTILTPNTGWFGALVQEFNSSNTSVQGDLSYALPWVTPSITGGLVRGAGDFDTKLSYGGVGLRGPFGKIEDAHWEVGYKYYDYYEHENNSINDYTAHVVMVEGSKTF